MSLLAAGVGVRAVQARGALLYPDGYQYLLMARGIAAHLRPVLELGRGGDHFVPSADAAAKPLFPALIALAHGLGLGWTGAARAVSVVAGGAAAALCGLVATRLAGSRTAGAGAATLVLLDPLSRYWAAYSSPDGLGQALALGSVLALLSRRPRPAGVLAGLAIFARPELGLLLAAGGAAAATRQRHRRAALTYLTATLATAACVLAALRPPLDLHAVQLGETAAGALALGALALLAPPSAAVATGIAGLCAVGLLAPALQQLAARDPPLVTLAIAGVLIARRRRPAAVLSVAACALAVVYDLKNGASSRYAVQLVPLAALGAAAGTRVAVTPRTRRAVLAAGAAAVAAVAALAAPPPPAADMFGAVARELPRTQTPLVTAAADAYGFLLYPRPVRTLVRGSRGLLLLDAAARAYDPGISVRGKVLARLAPGNGFLRPDGTLDLRSALLVSGTAVQTPTSARTLAG